MKNITVALSDQAHKGIRVWAAEHETSVSAIIQSMIEVVIAQKSEKDEITNRVRALNAARARLQARERDIAAAADALKLATPAPPFRPFHSSVDSFSRPQNLCTRGHLPQRQQPAAENPSTSHNNPL